MSSMHQCVIAALVLAAGCGGKARGPEAYRNDTQSLLEARSAQLQSCYDAALATDATLAGKVRVSFVVAKKTGAVKDAKVDPATAAPAPLNACVLKVLEGLVLDPADRNEGRATFEYEFRAPPAST